MKYRFFEAANTDISLLGIGAMRFPTIEGSDKIDEAESIRMMRYAIDNGVNYIDTAHVYQAGESETVVGKALAGGYREKVFIATKLAFWAMDGPEEMLPMFESQLKRLQTDYIDMYLVHDITGATRWDVIKKWKIWDMLSKVRDEGKIRFIGFSYHGETPEEFKTVIDEYPWDFVQLQINYMDKDLQAGVEGFEYARSKGIPVIVMEPLKGGKLTDVIPPSIQKYWDSLGSTRSPAEWALRWAANLPGVLTILSGMSSMAHVVENVRVLSDADEGGLSASELAIIDEAAAAYGKLIAYPCTACKYCMPCTVDINIPVIMDLRNSKDLHGMTEKLKDEYGWFIKQPPSACTACGKCEEACPQHLEIIRAMSESAELFE